MQAAADPGLLLDREAELEALESAVGAASAGRGRLVVAEGAAGQGKTALLAVARRRAEQAGVGILAARGASRPRPSSERFASSRDRAWP